MSNNTQIATIRGKTSYAKILGDPVLNYSKDGKEWKMDLQIDKDVEKELKQLGIGDRVKRKDDYLNGNPYISFKQRELRPDGTPNEPISVKEADGKTPWDQNRLIGNDSVVDVKFTVRDYGPGKKKGVYIRAVRVLDLVPYEKEEFAPLDESDEFYKAAQEASAQLVTDEQFNKDFRPDLDDDLNDESPL